MPAWIPRCAAFTAAAALSVLPLAACQSSGSEVSVLQSPGVPLSPRASYAWAPQPAAADARITGDVQAKVKSAVDSALAAKGYRAVADPAAAQVLVSYRLGLEDRVRSQVEMGSGAPDHCGTRGCGEGPVDVSQTPFVEGMLSLELTDRASGKLAWRAVSRKPVLYENGGSQARLNAIVADMTTSLPGG